MDESEVRCVLSLSTTGRHGQERELRDRRICADARKNWGAGLKKGKDKDTDLEPGSSYFSHPTHFPKALSDRFQFSGTVDVMYLSVMLVISSVQLQCSRCDCASLRFLKSAAPWVRGLTKCPGSQSS